jgi:hypothetical protein
MMKSSHDLSNQYKKLCLNARKPKSELKISEFGKSFTKEREYAIEVF